MHKYGIIIYWSEEDQVFIAEVPDLPGCMTHGLTQSAALANANKAIRAWVETANKFGDPVPMPTGERVVPNSAVRNRRRPLVRMNNPRNFFNAIKARSTENPEAH